MWLGILMDPEICISYHFQVSRNIVLFILFFLNHLEMSNLILACGSQAADPWEGHGRGTGAAQGPDQQPLAQSGELVCACARVAELFAPQNDCCLSHLAVGTDE